MGRTGKSTPMELTNGPRRSRVALEVERMLRGLKLGLLIVCASACQAAEAPWRLFYDRTLGFALQPSSAWVGEGTRSEFTPEGLRIVDDSTKAHSGRLYRCQWRAQPSRLGSR